MFKLFKDLTRAPEPLNRAPTNESSQVNTLQQPYTPRQRNRSPTPGLPTTYVSSETANGRRASVARPVEAVKEEVETDEDALKVVELLKQIEEAGTRVMTYVEVSRFPMYH